MNNYLAICVIALTTFYACTPEEPPCDTIYFSSFENIDELENFVGNGYYRGAATPSNGGDSSIVVCGGCIGPHLYFDLGPFEEEMEVAINFMSKTDYGGEISIYALTELNNKQTITILDTAWTYYATEDNLLLPANDTLRVLFSSGGEAAVTTIFDLLTIINCEE